VIFLFSAECIYHREPPGPLHVARTQAVGEQWCAGAAVFFSPPARRWTLPGHSKDQGLGVYSFSSAKPLISAVTGDSAVNICSGKEKAKNMLVAQTTRCLFYYSPLNIVFNQVDLLRGCLPSARVPAVQW